jgi:hypothetical protein
MGASIQQSSNIKQFNGIVSREQVPDVDQKLVSVSKKELEKLAKKLISQFPAKRVLMAAGCSSFAKLRFSCFIAYALRESGFDCAVPATDNYDKMCVDIPFSHDGLKNFDPPVLADRVRCLRTAVRS